MKRLFGWVRDESGAILSAEAALLGTIGVLGAVVGVNLFAGSVNDELRDVAYSFRSLDQSYSVVGHSSPTAWTAGSGFTQEPVEVSLAKLREREEELRERQRLEEERREEAAEAEEAADRDEEEGDRDEEARDRDDEGRDGDRERDRRERRRDREHRDDRD